MSTYMPVEVNGFPQWRIFFLALEKRGLFRQSVAVPLADGFDEGARVNALVDVQRGGGHLERGMLLLARPDQLRIEMRIVVQIFARLYGRDGLNVVVDFVGGKERIGLRRHQTDGRIVDSLLVLVLVTINRTFRRLAAFTFGARHLLLAPYISSRKRDCIRRRRQTPAGSLGMTNCGAKNLGGRCGRPSVPASALT